MTGSQKIPGPREHKGKSMPNTYRSQGTGTKLLSLGTPFWLRCPVKPSRRGVCAVCVFFQSVCLCTERREGCCVSVSGCVFVPATPFSGIHVGARVLCVSVWILLWVPLLLWSVCLADATVCGSKPSLQVGAQSSLLTWDTGDICPHTLEICNQGGGGRGPREGGVGGGSWGAEPPRSEWVGGKIGGALL